MKFLIFFLSVLATAYASEDDVPSCIYYFTKPDGVLESPNYPDKDPFPINCTYTIIAPRGHVIQLMIAHIDLTNSIDFLTIIDGSYEAYPTIDTLTGSKYFLPMRTYDSSTNYLFVKYEKHSTTGNPVGFRACYRVIPVKCGGELMASDGGKIAHAFSGDSSDAGKCVWAIQAPPEYAIRLEMRHSGGSDYDSLILMKWENNNSETIPAYGNGIFRGMRLITSPILYVIYEHRNSAENASIWFDYNFVYDYKEKVTRLGKSQRFERLI